MPTRLKPLYRPNQDCLFCGAKLTRPPNTQRAFYYCGEDCWRPCNRSVRFFNPELPKGKGRGTPVQLLAFVWWVLRQADTPLSGNHIHERIYENFNDHSRLTAKKGIHRLLNYFKPETYERLDTKPIEYRIVQDIPFNQALKPKYLSAILKYKKPVPKKKGKTP